MTHSWRRALALAVGAFVALFLLRLILAPAPVDGGLGLVQAQQVDSGRKNYASMKMAPGLPAPAESQRYEKIATLSQSSDAFEADRTKLLSAVGSHQGIIQIERATGLVGRRTLALGIGVPPERFDDFIKAAQAIGRNLHVDVVKNDKTNEYLQLKARRATLEKSRMALQGLATSGGSIDERLKVNAQLAEIEDKLQSLGVSLGEFDSQNELCTVRVTLAERIARNVGLARQVFDALSWTVFVYAGFAFGLVCVTAALWALFALATAVLRAVRTP